MNKIKKNIQNFFGNRFYCSVDIGSEKIKACLGYVESADQLDILSVCETDTQGFTHQGVCDAEDLSVAISKAMDYLYQKTGIHIKDASLAVGGDFISTRISRAVIPLTEHGHKLITEHDIQKVRKQASLLGAKIDEEVIGDFVRYFKVDDIDIASNPVGLFGRKIEVEVMLIVSHATRLRNVSKAMKQAGVEVTNVFFNGQALVDVLMPKDKRHQGSVMIDMGALHTQVLILKEGFLKHYVQIPFGGQYITKAIQKQLGVSYDLAEDIKKSYGCVSNKEANDHREFLITKEEGTVAVSPVVLNEVIEKEVISFIEQLKQEIHQSGYAQELKGSIFMVGGGVLLPGLMERIELDVKMPVVLGRNIPGLANAASFAVVTCVAEVSYKGTARYLLDTHKTKDYITSLKNKFEELCNEYF